MSDNWPSIMKIKKIDYEIQSWVNGSPHFVDLFYCVLVIKHTSCSNLSNVLSNSCNTNTTDASHILMQWQYNYDTLNFNQSRIWCFISAIIDSLTMIIATIRRFCFSNDQFRTNDIINYYIIFIPINRWFRITCGITCYIYFTK